MPEVPRLVLGSTSPYRRELLSRLGVPFDVARPEVDESPQPGEPPAALAVRLAEQKACAVSRRSPGAIVIGSDQVAEVGGASLGKPGGREGAQAQLLSMSGRAITFVTAVSLARDDTVLSRHVDRTVVRFRTLDPDEVARYVDAERPFDCAGSFKSEGLGITLFDAIDTHDPTALIGLPLIATARLLRAAGFALP